MDGMGMTLTAVPFRRALNAPIPNEENAFASQLQRLRAD